MELIERLMEMEFNITRYVDVRVVIGTKTYTKKCFILSVVDGIKDIYPEKYDKDTLRNELISIAEKKGVGQDEMFDTEKHMDLINHLEKTYNVQIHVRMSSDGAPGHVNDDSVKDKDKDNYVINVLKCFVKTEKGLKETFVYVAYHGDLGDFVYCSVV